MDKVKQEYNDLLKRYNKANDYFDRDIPLIQKEKFLEDFKDILHGLNYCLARIEVYTRQEVLEGFHHG